MPFDLASAKPIDAKPKAKFDLSSAKPVPELKTEEPGWFQPGSKSEALVRGFSQGATLGFGDELQAAIRALGDDGPGGYTDRYARLRDEERAANANASNKNPGSYLAGNVAGALPAVLATGQPAGGGAAARLIQTAQSGARLGAIQGAGTSESTDAAGLVEDVGKGALIGGTSTVVPLAVAQGARGALATVAGTGLKGAPTLATGRQAANRAILEANKRAADAAVTRAADAAAAGTGTKAAVIAAQKAARDAEQAIANSTGFGQKVIQAARDLKNVPVIGPVTSAVDRLTGPVAANTLKAMNATGAARMGSTTQSTIGATALALQNMSGRQARAQLSDADAQIQRAVSAGQPEYAATFQALQDPATRAAQRKISAGEAEAEPDAQDEDEQDVSED